MGTSYSHYVFQTLTYSRDNSCRHTAWWNVSSDTTDYLKRLRRSFKPALPIEHLRVIEFHKDYYPHVHILLHFHNALTISNRRFFTPEFYSKLQSLWTKGFSKPEVLKFPDGAFSYVLKYFLKQIANQSISGSTGQLSDSTPDTPVLPPRIWPLKGKRITVYGVPIRLLAWSRGMQYLYQLRQQRTLIDQKGIKLPLSSKLVSRKIGIQTRMRADYLNEGQT